MNIQLTISLLASDRPDTLEKCLSSLTPFLKELNSELIVVFTGKEQETLELIRRYTTHIVPFTWCDDFSAARNAGLKEASGEWFLYIDDDEWFEDPSEIIRFFQSGEYRQYQSAHYVVRNYTDWSGKNYADASVGRMCRLTPNTRFVNRIHEFPQPFSEPGKMFKCYAHHYGYAEKESIQSSAPRFERNIRLLLKQYEKTPDVQNCMQLVQEYQSVDDFDTAIQYCRKGLKLGEKDRRVGACELWMQVRLPLLLSSAGKPEEALQEGERLLRHPRTLEVGQAHLHGILAALCWELKEYEKGIKHVQGYHAKMVYLQNHPDKAERQNGATITYDSAKDRAMSTYVAGLLSSSELNNMRQAGEILSWIPWSEEKRVSPQYGNFEKWKQNYPGQKRTILERFSKLRTDNFYVTLQKALYAEEMQRIEETESYFNLCIPDCPDGFLCQLVELAARNSFSLCPLLERVSIETWDECAQYLSANMEITDMPGFIQSLRPGMEDYPICAGRLEQYFQERQLTEEVIEMPRLAELLRQYCNSVTAEANTLYKEEIISDPGHYALPFRYKFAFYMDKALDSLENETYEDCIPLLKKAAHAFPDMSSVVGKLGEYLDGQVQAKTKPPVSEEFLMLGQQVKQILHGLMANGQWAEAYGVVNQLVSILPDDLEAIKLKQEILRHQ